MMPMEKAQKFGTTLYVYDAKERKVIDSLDLERAQTPSGVKVGKVYHASYSSNSEILLSGDPLCNGQNKSNFAKVIQLSK